MLAEHAHGARLRPFLALFLNERHWRSDRELIERITQHARAIEVDPVLAGLYEAEAVGSRQCGDLAMRRDLVRLDGATLLSRKVLQSPARGVERLTDGHSRVSLHTLDLVCFVMRFFFDVLQPSVQRPFVAHHNRRTAGHRQFDAHVEVASIMTMAMRLLDEHTAPDHARVELFEPRHALTDV
jgi:hypothetical protein